MLYLLLSFYVFLVIYVIYDYVKMGWDIEKSNREMRARMAQRKAEIEKYFRDLSH